MNAEARAAVRTTVRNIADRWRGLLAWGSPITGAIDIVDGSGGGYAKHDGHACIVFSNGSLARSLTTVLHEMAHMAAPAGELHGRRWRGLLARATHEVTGVPVPDGAPMQVMDELVESAVRSWLTAERRAR